MQSTDPTESIVALTQELVRTPSQGGIDPLQPIVQRLLRWLSAHDVHGQQLRDAGGRPVGVLAIVDSGCAGPTICLDAPIDTAPVGTLTSWRHDPFGAEIRGTRMYGRGTADAKVGVAIFCHVAHAVQAERTLPTGKLLILLDGDEHTGQFGGVKAFIESCGDRPDFVAVGYPGNDSVKIGARGFYRITATAFGTERHSGSQADTRPQNAILKMARFIRMVSDAALPAEQGDFSFGPKLSVTEISGGHGFSQIPGSCSVKVDIRTTPIFSEDAARALIRDALGALDREMPTERSSVFVVDSAWPAYKLSETNAHVTALRDSAAHAFAKPVELAVCGPSNIGNYLASKGVPSTCGFGVSYDHQHAANEYIELTTILPVFQTYRDAVVRMTTR